MKKVLKTLNRLVKSISLLPRKLNKGYRSFVRFIGGLPKKIAAFATSIKRGLSRLFSRLGKIARWTMKKLYAFPGVLWRQIKALPSNIKQGSIAVFGLIKKLPSYTWTFIKNLPRNTVKFVKNIPRYTVTFVKNLPTYFDKTKYALSHNFVFRASHEYWTLFNTINIRVTNKRRQAIIGVSFIFIWIVGYLIFALYPMAYSLYLSFFKVRLDGSAIVLSAVGIDNYKAAFLYDPYFVEILIEYVVEMILNVPITIVFALIIAMLINQDIKGKGIWRTIFFLPVIITTGPVIQELMAQGATTLPSIDDFQIVDLVLANLNQALANPIQALFDTILLVLWFTGIQILIFLAGLQKIDREVYEASQIDGAGPWESFWKITLPSIMPLITVVIIYTVVSMSVFGLNEIIIYIRTVMLGESTVGTLTTGYGYSAALAWIYFVVMVILILVFVGAINIRRRSRR